MLAILVALNLLRAAIIDPLSSGGWGKGCPTVKYSDTKSAGIIEAAHRSLGGDSSSSSSASAYASNACKTYILLYTYVCAAILFLFAVGMYVITIVYIDRILRMSIVTDKLIDPKQTKSYKNQTELYRSTYKDSLKLMMRREQLLAISNEMGKTGDGKSFRGTSVRNMGNSTRNAPAQDGYDSYREGVSLSSVGGLIKTATNKVLATSSWAGSKAGSKAGSAAGSVAGSKDISVNLPFDVEAGAIAGALVAEKEEEEEGVIPYEAASHKSTHADHDAVDAMVRQKPEGATYSSPGEGKGGHEGQEKEGMHIEGTMSSIFLFGSPAAYFKVRVLRVYLW